ncbi:MAG: hypothetical protein JHD02_00265 [Thermoleophilaceae bacterium]|nr:hypothetical protein [Thermoleophilaceae bacterium]
MTATLDTSTPVVLPCADPPAAVTFEILDAYDGSLSWVQEPLAHVYVYVGEEQLDSLFVYLGSTILEFFTPPEGVVVPPAALAAADAQAQKEIRAMCESIDFMLEPALDSTWKDVPNDRGFCLPCRDSVEPKYIWDDATQGGGAERRKLLEFAFDPRNNLLVSRFDPAQDHWRIESPELSYEIRIRPKTGEIRVTAKRGHYEIASEHFDASDPELEPFADPVTISGLPGADTTRAIVRSCAKAIRHGKLTRETERTITSPRAPQLLTNPAAAADN